MFIVNLCKRYENETTLIHKIKQEQKFKNFFILMSFQRNIFGRKTFLYSKAFSIRVQKVVYYLQLLKWSSIRFRHFLDPFHCDPDPPWKKMDPDPDPEHFFKIYWFLNISLHFVDINLVNNFISCLQCLGSGSGS